ESQRGEAAVEDLQLAARRGEIGEDRRREGAVLVQVEATRDSREQRSLDGCERTVPAKTAADGDRAVNRDECRQVYVRERVRVVDREGTADLGEVLESLQGL